ncbi:hypothetical protein GCM10010517_79820 [Streptosporangium fragile]|uniref:Uncharacterized protein n=1 Tax=Streptosporangium fragile TaxID=46186 RepID=A0ABN3WHR1_9ACTN
MVSPPLRDRRPLPAATDGGRTAPPPATLAYSLALGLVFAGAWLGFAAMRARDGRMPVTDWLDPLLAGATLGIALLAITALLVLWPGLPATPARTTVAILLVASQWTYIAGEVLSNTITIGEPPGDVGGLMEITSGALTGAGTLLLAFLTVAGGRHGRTAAVIGAVAVTVAASTGWWFTHPIDQSTPGTPACVPGNPLYNLAHGSDC